MVGLLAPGQPCGIPFLFFLTFYVFIKKVDRILYLEITWRLAVLKDHVKRTWKPSVRGSQGPNMEPFELQ